MATLNGHCLKCGKGYKLCEEAALFALQVKRVESLHWKLDNPEDFLPDTFPVTFGLADGKGFYSIPVAEYTNMMKVNILFSSTNVKTLPREEIEEAVLPGIAVL